MRNKIQELNCGEFSWAGYMKTIRDYVCESQLYDRDTWKLFINQYRTKADKDCGWRGEYWGKMMRGACQTYKCVKDKKLYLILEETVREFLSIQEDNGRFSTYPIEKEFSCWDMWCRKYVLLGYLYFYEICVDEELKFDILKALSRHLDYIIEHIGSEEGKIDILDTSKILEGLNSSSILEPVVKMYVLTENKKYLDFAEYIISRGFTRSQNIIEFLSQKNNYPYQCNVKKAYEMMSCFQGLLEYAKVVDNKEYFDLVETFAEKLSQTDMTIIGTAACDSEFFDHSSITQTNYIEENMQETCVTVTWMNLCYQLLKQTGKSVYADYMEKSLLNAMHGSVNLLNQNAKFASVWNGTTCKVDNEAHEVFPFDSYSPLYQKRRGVGIGGFNRMENGRSYGCCACIGSLGTALGELFGVMKNDDTIFVNLYSDGIIQTSLGQNKVKLSIKKCESNNNRLAIRVEGKGDYRIALRMPYWSDEFNVLLDGKFVDAKYEDGYFIIDNSWDNNEIEIYLSVDIKAHKLNDKIAFSYGPYILARDERFLEDITKPIGLDEDTFKWSTFANNMFNNNESFVIETNFDKISLCDYASAGKNFDDDKSKISVWMDLK